MAERWLYMAVKWMFEWGETHMDAAKWDKSAGDYQKVFEAGRSEYNDRLITFLLGSGMAWPGCRVLDVGCGVGKYGCYLAAIGCDVTLTDISPEMLRRAEENMKVFSTPWRTVLADFNSLSPSLPALSGGFDLAMATMSPAIHDLDTVKKLSSLSRGWCFVTNFVSWRQPLRDCFYKSMGVEPVLAMAGGMDTAEKLTEAVRLAGYEPQMRHESYDWADMRSPEEAAEYLLKRHPQLDENDPELLSKARDTAAGLAGEDGLLRDEVFTRVAWLSWKTKTED